MLLNNPYEICDIFHECHCMHGPNPVCKCEFLDSFPQEHAKYATITEPHDLTTMLVSQDIFALQTQGSWNATERLTRLGIIKEMNAISTRFPHIITNLSMLFSRLKNKRHQP